MPRIFSTEFNFTNGRFSVDEISAWTCERESSVSDISSHAEVVLELFELVDSVATEKIFSDEAYIFFNNAGCHVAAIDNSMREIL